MPLNATLKIQKMPEFQINTKNVLALETFNKYELGLLCILCLQQGI